MSRTIRTFYTVGVRAATGAGWLKAHFGVVLATAPELAVQFLLQGIHLRFDLLNPIGENCYGVIVYLYTKQQYVYMYVYSIAIDYYLLLCIVIY